MAYMKHEENIYYNVNISNTTNNPIPATFSAAHTYPLLNKPNEYSVSVVRFFIPGTGVPIFNFTSIPTPLVISITNPHTTTSISSTIVYEPSWNLTPSGVPGAVWSYQQFLSYINTSLASIISQISLIDNTPFLNIFMWFDTVSDSFKIRFPSINEAVLQVYMNAELFNFFPTFPAKRLGYSTPNNQDVLLVLNTSLPSNIVTTGVYDLPTEVNCQYAWNGLVRIFVMSPQLNSRCEYNYSPIGSNIQIPILTDFEPSINGDFRVNDVFQYIPGGELRRIDLQGSDPLTKLDFQFFWEDLWGKVYPMNLLPGAFLSMKLLFQKRK